MHSLHDAWLLGMRVFWWLFWIPVVILLVTVLLTTRKRKRESPLETLKRRYASGEISTAEYMEHKRKLEDASSTAHGQQPLH